MDVFVIDNSEKPDHPSDGIIGFPRGECYTHATTFLGEEGLPHRVLQDGVARKDSTGTKVLPHGL